MIFKLFHEIFSSFNLFIYWKDKKGADSLLNDDFHACTYFRLKLNCMLATAPYN